MQRKLKPCSLTFNKAVKSEGELQIKIGGECLEQVSCFKYLVLWFDPVLNWKNHIDCFSKKISQCIGVQSRIQPFISAATANTLFKTMIDSIIAYGDIWFKGPLSNLQRIQKRQNKVGTHSTLQTVNQHI